MPTIVVNGLPQDVFDRLEKWAAQRKRTIVEEAADVLTRAYLVMNERGQFSEDVDPPFELPRPPSLGMVESRRGLHQSRTRSRRGDVIR